MAINVVHSPSAATVGGAALLGGVGQLAKERQQFNESNRRFGLGLDLQRDQFAEGQRQFDANLDFRQDQFAESQHQFDQNAQFQAYGLGQRDRQIAADIQQNRQRLALAQQQQFINVYQADQQRQAQLFSQAMAEKSRERYLQMQGAQQATLQQQRFGQQQAAAAQQFGYQQVLNDQLHGNRMALGEQAFGFDQQLGDQRFGHQQQLGDQRFGQQQALADQRFGQQQTLAEQGFGFDQQLLGQREAGMDRRQDNQLQSQMDMQRNAQIARQMQQDWAAIQKVLPFVDESNAESLIEQFRQNYEASNLPMPVPPPPVDMLPDEMNPLAVINSLQGGQYGNTPFYLSPDGEPQIPRGFNVQMDPQVRQEQQRFDIEKLEVQNRARMEEAQLKFEFERQKQQQDLNRQNAEQMAAYFKDRAKLQSDAMKLFATKDAVSGKTSYPSANDQQVVDYIEQQDQFLRQAYGIGGNQPQSMGSGGQAPTADAVQQAARAKGLAYLQENPNVPAVNINLPGGGSITVRRE